MKSIVNNFSPLIHSLKYLAGPMLIGIALIAVVCLFFLKKTNRLSSPEYKPLIVAFCFLGVILGVIAGGSTTPIGEALVTGVLGVITALLTYLLSKDTVQIWRVFIPYVMIALLFSSFVGLIVGANYKVINRSILAKNKMDEQLWGKYYEEVMLPMCLREKEKILEGWKPPSDYSAQCKSIAKALKN